MKKTPTLAGARPILQRLFRVIALLATIVITHPFASAPASAMDLVWTNTAGGSWSKASNWSPNQSPATGDAVWITRNGTYTVTLDVAATIASLVLGGTTGTQTLSQVSGVNLTLNGPCSSSTQGVYALSSGSLQGTGSMTLMGPFRWSAGAIVGLAATPMIIAANGGFTLSGPSSKTVTSAQIVNGKSGSWTGGSVRFNSNSSFSNALNATFDLVGDGSSFLQTSGSPWFANLGTLRKTIGAGTTILSVPVDNSGTVEVNAGVLALTVADSSGRFTPGAGATLSLDGSATFSDTASISGSGHFTLSGATLTNNGVFNVAGTNLFVSGVAILNGPTFITNSPLVVSGGTLTLNGSGAILPSSVRLSSGSLFGSLPIGVSGSFLWTGGTFGNAASSLAMTVDGGITASGGPKNFSGGMIVNWGLATWNAGQILFRGSAVFSNAPGSILDLPHDGAAMTLASGSPLLANSGTIRKSAGTGNTILNLPLESSGRVEALSGTLALSGGGVSGGEFFADWGGTLLFDGGESSLLPASKLGGPGAVTVAAAVSIQGELAIGALKNSSSLSLAAGGNRFVTNLTMGSGVLSGGGILRVPGSFTWTGGAIGNGGSAPVVIAEGEAILSGGPKSLNTGVLINGGVAKWLGGQVIFFGVSILSNAANAVIDMQADGNAFVVNSVGSQFFNAGLLKRTGALGAAVVSVPCDNAGAVVVNSGTLALILDDSTGTFAIPATTATLSVSGTATLSPTASITGPGNFEMTSGAFTNNGLFSVSGTNTFRGGVTVIGGNCAINGGAIVVSGGTVFWNGTGVVSPDSLVLSSGLLQGSMALSVSGPFNWTGGTIGSAGSGLVLSAQGNTTLSVSAKLLNGGTLINRGLLTWLSGQVICNGTAVLSNAPGGIVELQGDGNSFLFNSGAPLFLNAGLLRRTGSAGAAMVSLPVNNSGIIQSDAGSFAVAIGDSSGSFVPNAGATLSVSGPAILSASSAVTGSGVMVFNGGAITHNGLWNITGTNVVSSGSVVQNGTCIMTNRALLVNGGTLTLNGNGLIAPLSVSLSGGGLSGSLAMSAPGSFLWTGGALGSAAGTTRLTCGGTLSIAGGASKFFHGGTLVNADAGAWTEGFVIFNNGSVMSNAPGATLDIQGDGSAFLLNTGPSVLANGGLLRRTSGAGTAQISLPCYNSGTVQVGSGVLGFGSAYVQSGGQTLVSGGSLNFGQTAQLIGGSLGGNGTVTGSVSNNATVSPGASPGLLSITGNYTEGPGARLRIELAGTTAGVTYDQLSVGGKAKLAGVLEISYLNGFVPAPGNVFTALVCSARSGGFSRLEAPTNAMGTIYTPKSVLVETGNASPGTQLLVDAAPIVCRTFSLRATAADLDGSVTNIAILLDNATLASVSGGAVEVTFSSDSPGPLSFTAIATDNKGAQGATNIVVDVSTLPPLVLDAVGFETSRAFKLCMRGEADKSYTVEGNEDFGATAWPTLGPMISTNGIWQFFDTTATNAPHRTYRARSAP